jgi:hypothetical protein
MSTTPDTYADAVFAQARRCLSGHERALSNLWFYEQEAQNGSLNALELCGYLHGLFVADLLIVEDYEEMVSALRRESRRAAKE